MKVLNPAKVVLLIQVFNSFISGILVVALPLIMKERNINIVAIGLIFSLMPIVFQFGRTLFAIISDFLGRKLFFILNGFLCIISSSIYYLAHTPTEFLFGKVMEGTKDGTLWAVNRAYILEKSESKLTNLVYLRIVNYIFNGIGGLLAGFL